MVHVSITNLHSQLEAAVSLADAVDHARRLITRLQVLVEEFKLHHFSVIDLLNVEEDLAQEQEIFDSQDWLTLCLEKLISSSSSANPNQQKIAFKRLQHLEHSCQLLNTHFRDRKPHPRAL